MFAFLGATGIKRVWSCIVTKHVAALVFDLYSAASPSRAQYSDKDVAILRIVIEITIPCFDPPYSITLKGIICCGAGQILGA